LKSKAKEFVFCLTYKVYKKFPVKVLALGAMQNNNSLRKGLVKLAIPVLHMVYSNF